MSPKLSSEVRLEGVGKRYGEIWAVRDVTLTILPAPPVIMSAPADTATLGLFYSYQINATNNPNSYGATLGAGTTLTQDAPADQLTFSRVRQISKPEWKRPVRKSKD